MLDLIDRLREYASTRKGELAELITEAADALERPTCDDAVSRQAAIKTLEKGLPSEPLKSKYTEGITVGFGLAITWIEQLPSVQPQPEEDCDTCKHGYFGDRQCDNCRVRYPSHYEREEEQHGSD